MKDICPECNGSKWVNTVGAKTIATVEADPFKSYCPACRMLDPGTTSADSVVVSIQLDPVPLTCPQCRDSRWVNDIGKFSVKETSDFKVPCPTCRRAEFDAARRPMVAPEPPPPPPAAYQPEALALLGRTVAAVEQAAAEAKPSPEEVATWEAEKAAQTARAEAHKAHMDRAEQRALKSLAIEERKAAALEQIAKEAVQIATLLENLNNMAGWPR